MTWAEDGYTDAIDDAIKTLEWAIKELKRSRIPTPDKKLGDNLDYTIIDQSIEVVTLISATIPANLKVGRIIKFANLIYSDRQHAERGEML